MQGQSVPVLLEGQTTKYLGRELRLDAHDDAEIDNRINGAWRRFMSLRKELCNQHFPLMQRMRLFGATVSATLVYGAGTWTINEDRASKPRGAQRRMLRSMLQRKRARTAKTSAERWREESEEERTEEEAEEEEVETDSEGESDTAVPNQEDEEEKDGEEIEPWHEWVQRVTRLALKEMKREQVEDWVDAARDRQFKLAGHISRRNDNRWSTVALNWAPSDGGRKVGHPLKRWEDDINQCLIALGLIKKAGEWRIFAEDRETWQQWGVQSKEFWKTV